MGKFVLLTMRSIVILGTGNLAQHLFTAIEACKDFEVRQVFGRPKSEERSQFDQLRFTSDPKTIIEADIYCIAVSDRAIAEVSEHVKARKGLVVHTSGNTPMEVLLPQRKGVFYPLQTFSKGQPMVFQNIPICVEALHPSDEDLLLELANALSDSVHKVHSQQRRKLHLAAVFANNFTNHLLGLGEKVLREAELPFDLLGPLVQETVCKALEIGPRAAQTGPARRADSVTMETHLNQLQEPEHQKIYRILSESIKQEYEKKL
ncbi:MAG: DUF2520 domain-containing protein [Flavobacteriaceae bacterium]|nr:DUF2520 domain-containing protein [Flavobacteriaceae bacterium]